MSFDLSKLQSGTGKGARGGFTLVQKAEIYFTRWARNVANKDIARAVGRTDARVSEICNLRDWDGDPKGLGDFFVAVKSVAEKNGYTFTVKDNAATFTKVK